MAMRFLLPSAAVILFVLFLFPSSALAFSGTIKASPNPCAAPGHNDPHPRDSLPESPDNTCASTITWNSDSPTATVFVTGCSRGTNTYFAGGSANGSVVAPWVDVNGCTFNLYAANSLSSQHLATDTAHALLAMCQWGHPIGDSPTPPGSPNWSLGNDYPVLPDNGYLYFKEGGYNTRSCTSASGGVWLTGPTNWPNNFKSDNIWRGRFTSTCAPGSDIPLNGGCSNGLYTFRTTCDSSNHRISQAVCTVRALGPPSINVSWSPNPVQSGDTGYIRWIINDATYCAHSDPTLGINVGVENTPGNAAWFNNSYYNNGLGWGYGNRTTNGETWTVTCYNGPTGPVTRSATLTVTTPTAPTCTSAAPQSPTTGATSGNFSLYAYGVSSNTTMVYFPTWGDTGGQDDLIWYPGTNQGGGTWKADVNLANHKSGNPEYGNFNVHVYMNAPGYTNTWCGTANFSRVQPVNGACAATHYNCTAGASINNVDGPTSWTWSCQGTGGGSTASCSENKPPACAPTHYNCTVGTSSGGTRSGPNWTWSCTNGGTTIPCSQSGPPARGDIVPNSCTISSGNSSCAMNVAWSSNNTNGTVTVKRPYAGNSTFATGTSGNQPATFTPPGSYQLDLYDGNTLLDSAAFVASCAAGSSWNGSICLAPCSNGATNPPTCNQCPNNLGWNGSSCIACSNGGCTGPGGNPSNPTGGLSCNNGATNPLSCSIFTPTALLSANPTTITTGNSSTLTWSSTNATSCTSLGGFSTGGAPAGNTSTGPLTSTQNYQISCTGPGGTVNSNVATVTVVQPSATLTATPPRVYSGENTNIQWSATNVTSCSISGPGLSATGTSGSRSVVINSQALFTLTCQTVGQPLVKTVLVNIIPDFQEF